MSYIVWIIAALFAVAVGVYATTRIDKKEKKAEG